MSESLLSQLVGQLLGNREVIVYSPALARAIGDPEATLFLCQACYWQSIVGAGQWFYKLRDAERDPSGNMLPPGDARRQSWEWETGLSRTRQESARRRLKTLGLLEEVLQGVPARLHYRVPFDRVAHFLLERQQLAGFLPTGWESPRPPVGSDGVSKLAENPPTITETTSEPTSEPTTTTRAQRGGGWTDAMKVTGLVFERSIASHRQLLTALLKDLPLQDAQGLADELAGVIEAASSGRHPGVKSVRGWVTHMVQQARDGAFVLDRGLVIQKRRAQRAEEALSPAQEGAKSADPEVARAYLRKSLEALAQRSKHV